MIKSMGYFRRPLVWLGILAGLVMPALTAGDTLHLRDGSILRGQVIGFSADTLRFRTSFGSEIRVERDRIAWIDFTDSVVTPGTAPGVAAAGAVQSGEGSIAVTFKDKKVSSKIVVTKNKDEAAHLRANWIMQLLIVDGDTAFSYVDSTMDKTIYEGPDRKYKNVIEIKDIYVELSVGLHQLTLVVRNVGLEDYSDRFDGGPVNMEFVIGDVKVVADRENRVHIGMSRGKLRTKKPKFYRVE